MKKKKKKIKLKQKKINLNVNNIIVLFFKKFSFFIKIIIIHLTLKNKYID